MGTRSWPTVERDSEFTATRSALVNQPDVCGILLIGDAGVGKTTLARSVTQTLRSGVHWVGGTESARSIPLGVFAHLVGAAASNDPVIQLATAMDAVRGGQYAVIGVDDVHLLDHLSATLLHQLALEGAVRIVATARCGEPLPDAITALWKDGYLQRLTVPPFSRAESVSLIEAALGGHLERLSAEVMWDASGGNALFVRHLVDGALERGALRLVNGVWQLRGTTTVTSELATLLGARLEQLPDDEQHALHLLAFGEPLALDTLTELAGADTLERAERRGLIRIVNDGDSVDVRFAHGLFGEVIRHTLGRVSARRIKADLFHAMRKRPADTPAERIRHAALALDADVSADVDLFIRAAKDALALTNITVAEDLARAAVNRGGGLVASELLARCLGWQGKTVQSEQILSSFDPESLSELELARWGIARIANLQWSVGDNAAAAELLDMLQQRITHPRVRLVIDGLAAALLVLDCRLEEAVALAERVLDEPAAPPAAVGWAVFGGAMAASLMGRTAEVAGMVSRGRQVNDQIDGVMRFLLARVEVRALTLAGEFDAAEARSVDIVRITSPSQYRARAMANVLAGTVEMARGRLGAAVSRLEETLAALSDETAASWSLPARILLAQSYCALGEPDAAAPLIAELRARIGGHPTMFEPQVRIAEAWLAAAEGHLSGAVSAALAAADVAAASGQRAVELMALHAAARFGDTSCLQRLIDVAGTIEGPLAAADAAHASGLLNHDGATVFSAAQEFERIGAMLSAADAAAQAAALFAAAGNRRNATEAAAAADRLGAVCGGLKTPALRTASQPLPLSPREREIADLVARGLSNRDIAERLVVSTRTVEGHLYRTFLKLDIPDREELATLMRRGR
ncbi:MAG TPA: LuxR C-terminal-related transcriptional regulator [Mycobacterium sp.]